MAVYSVVILGSAILSLIRNPAIFPNTEFPIKYYDQETETWHRFIIVFELSSNKSLAMQAWAYYLGITATSVTSEKVFSKAGEVLSKK